MNSHDLIFYNMFKDKSELKIKNYDLTMSEFMSDNNYYNEINNEEPFNLYYLDNEYIELNKASLKPIRIFRDMVTDVFTKVCIADNDNIENFDFINFLFQYIYSNLLEKINGLLTQENQLKKYIYPLLPNEYIVMYLKGGTLMKYFKGLDYLNYNIQNNELNNSIPLDFKKILN